jgi:hypothetical protein
MRLQWEELQRSLRKRKRDEHLGADEFCAGASTTTTTTTQTSVTGFGGGILGRRPIDKLFERRPTTDDWWSRLMSGAGGGGTRRDLPRNPAPLALEHVMPFLADYDFTTTPLVVTTLQYVDSFCLWGLPLSFVCVSRLLLVRQSTVHRLPDMGAQRDARPAAAQRGLHIFQLRSPQPILCGSCVVCACDVCRMRLTDSVRAQDEEVGRTAHSIRPDLENMSLLVAHLLIEPADASNVGPIFRCLCYVSQKSGGSVQVSCSVQNLYSRRGLVRPQQHDTHTHTHHRTRSTTRHHAARRNTNAGNR